MRKFLLVSIMVCVLCWSAVAADPQIVVIDQDQLNNPSLQAGEGITIGSEQGCSYLMVIEMRQIGTSVKKGDIVQIPILFQQNDQNLGNLEFRVLYNYYTKCPDSSYWSQSCYKYRPVLSLKSVEPGSLTSNSLFDYATGKETVAQPDSCKEGGTIEVDSISIAIASSSGFTGIGTVALLNFEVLDDTFVQDGIQDLCPPRIPAIHLDMAPSVGNTLAGDACELEGYYRGFITWEQPEKGDGNGDGLITSEDAYLALQMALGKIPQDLILDMDDDGKVTSNDARILLIMAQESQDAAVSGTSGTAIQGSGQAGQSGNQILPGTGNTIQNANSQKFVSNKEMRGATPIQLP